MFANAASYEIKMEVKKYLGNLSETELKPTLHNSHLTHVKA